MTTGKGTCSVPDCGRHVRALGLCQTHRKRLKTTGRAEGPIKPVRPRRLGAIRLGGCSLSPEAANAVSRCAEARGVAVNAVVTDVLETWARRRNRRK